MCRFSQSFSASPRRLHQLPPAVRNGRRRIRMTRRRSLQFCTWGCRSPCCLHFRSRRTRCFGAKIPRAWSSRRPLAPSLGPSLGRPRSRACQMPTRAERLLVSSCFVPREVEKRRRARSRFPGSCAQRKSFRSALRSRCESVPSTAFRCSAQRQWVFAATFTPPSSWTWELLGLEASRRSKACGRRASSRRACCACSSEQLGWRTRKAMAARSGISS
mmetsp:Transcript_35287/g.56786  ORF Transcript_35287/g.56786 Transcript_35287/m.56786 type:complete len:217 (-) Transcript_35287:706-1356(-)